MLNISSINSLIKTEMRLNYPGIHIVLDGQSKKYPSQPRINYTHIAGNEGSRQRIYRTFSEDVNPETTSTEYKYERYRYSVIVNEESEVQAGETYIALLERLSSDLLWYVRSQDFSLALNRIGVRSFLASSVQDVTIPRLPFNERSKFFDITYGYNDVHVRTEGTYIEQAEINGENKPLTP
jgi:hypothetical protein